jgi:hypothetical protein
MIQISTDSQKRPWPHSNQWSPCSGHGRFAAMPYPPIATSSTPGHRFRDEARVGQDRQLYQPDSVSKPLQDLRSHLESQSCLACAAGASEG